MISTTPPDLNAPRILQPKQIEKVLSRLTRRYPVPTMGLSFQTPWQLLIATILSARTTDTIVNQITPQLFARFAHPGDLASASLREIEELIRKSGTFKQKARNLQATAQAIVFKHDGEVPQTMEELTALAGVGRKTANVVLSHGFKKPRGVIVDTHVLRVCYRLGISLRKDPLKMELDLMNIVYCATIA